MAGRRGPSVWVAIVAVGALVTGAVVWAVTAGYQPGRPGVRAAPGGALDDERVFQAVAQVGGPIRVGDLDLRGWQARVGADRAFFGALHGSQVEVTGIDLATGRERWRTVVGPAGGGFLLHVAHRLVLVQVQVDTADGRAVLYGLDPADGRRVFERALVAPTLLTGPRLYRDYFVMSLSDGRLVKLSYAGRVLWESDPIGLVVPGPTHAYSDVLGDVLTDPRLVAVGEDGTARVVDVAAQRVVATRPGLLPWRTTRAEDKGLTCGGRLHIARNDGAGYRMEQVDLGLGDPTTLATVPGRRVWGIFACTADRVIVLDEPTRRGDGVTWELAVAVFGPRGEMWRSSVGTGDGSFEAHLVGGAILTNATRFGLRLFDGDGMKRAEVAGYTAAASIVGHSVVAVIDPAAADRPGLSTGATPAPPRPMRVVGLLAATGEVRDLATVTANRCAAGRTHMVCRHDRDVIVWRFAT